jgi:Holliday junction resolvasome RuvABC endonuclease subunit
LIASGTFDFKPRRFEGGGMRYLRFNQALDQLLAASGGFQRLVFEEVRRHLGVDAAHVYGGLLATLTAWAERKNIPYEAVPVGTWKKVLTGKGNASKDEVIAAVTAKGFDPIDHNQADALGILLWLGQ